MVPPLKLIHVYLSSTGEMDVFLQNTNWSLTVGQVAVKVNGVLINFLEGFGFVGGLEALS
jgi:hypothetical protein